MERQMFLWILFTASMMWFVESRLCQHGMRYHAHTHSCMIVIKQKKSYNEAEQYCNTNYFGGHLVYILDKETDTFVKELLDNKSTAFIGLKFKKSAYRWGDHNSTVTYFGWDMRALKLKSAYTAITRTGWIKEVYPSFFVCQQTCERNHEFLVGNTDLHGQTFTTRTHQKIILTCTTYISKSHTIRLIYRNTTSTEYELKSTDAQRLEFEINPKCSSSGQYECMIAGPTNVTRLNGMMKVICDAKYCNEKTNQTPSFELLYRNETCTVILCLWIYPQPSSFHLYKANEEIEDSNYDITFNYLTSYTTKGHLTVSLFQRYNFTPGPYHITLYKTNKRSSNIEFDLTVHIAKMEERHNNTNLVSSIIIVVSVNVIIISVIVAVIVIKLKRNSSKQEFSMTTENIYNNVSESVEIAVSQRPSHFERWSLRSTVIGNVELNASTQISDSANIAELTTRTDAKDEASDSRMTGEAEQTYANVTFITDGQRREQVLTKDPDQGGRMNDQENGRTSGAGINERTMTSQPDGQRTSYYDVGRSLGSEGERRTLGPEGGGRTLGPEGDGRTLGPEGDGRTLGPEGDGRTLGPEGDGRTLGPEGDGRTLGPEGDGCIRSLESEGRKLSPENVRISMIRNHNKRASGREHKSLRSSVKVNKYKDDPESCLLKNNSGKERLTFDSKHEEQTVDSKDKGHTVATENEEHSVGSDYKRHTFASENDGQTVESEYKGHTFSSENKECPEDSEYKGHKFALENDERTFDSKYKGHILASENDEQTVDSDYKGRAFASEDEKQTVDSEAEGRTVTSRDKRHTVESTDNDRTVNLKDEGLTVISDFTNDGRTISPEGLVYVSVVINPDTKKPEVAETRHSKTPYESVEYASINYSATLEAKVDNENE